MTFTVLTGLKNVLLLKLITDRITSTVLLAYKWAVPSEHVSLGSACNNDPDQPAHHQIPCCPYEAYNDHRSFPKPHLFMTGLKYTLRTASMRLNKIYSSTCRGKARTGLPICIDLSSNLLHKVSVAASLPTELEIQNKDPEKTAKIRLFILLIAYACKEVTTRDRGAGVFIP